MENLVLDLFSGTGSATDPFVECGRHRVIRVDIAGHPDFRCDVRSLPPFLTREHFEFVWASPPCQDFSTANPRRDPRRGLELVRAILPVLDHAEIWVVENVHGSGPYISGLLGAAEHIPGPQMLWTNAGFLLPRSNRWYKGKRLPAPEREFMPSKGRWVTHQFADSHRAGVGGWSAEEAGRIPRFLAEAVHEAVCPKGDPSQPGEGGD